MSKIEFDCPNCQAALRVSTKFAGRRVKCPSCQEPARIPAATEPANPGAIFENLFESDEDEAPQYKAKNTKAQQTNYEVESSSAPTSSRPTTAAPKSSTSPSTQTQKSPTESPAVSPALTASNAPTPPPTTSTKKSNDENDRDAHEDSSPFDDSMFDDIDAALASHETSAEPNEQIVPPTKPSAPKQNQSPQKKTPAPATNKPSRKPTAPRSASSSSSSSPVAHSPLGNTPEAESKPIPMEVESHDDDFCLDEHLEAGGLEFSSSETDSSNLLSNPTTNAADKPSSILDTAGGETTIPLTGLTSKEFFSIKCIICDSRVHIPFDAANTTVDCPICYTDIKVGPVPENESEKVETTRGSGSSSGGDEYSLAPATPLPPPDPSFGFSSSEDDLLAPRTTEAEQELSLFGETEESPTQQHQRKGYVEPLGTSLPEKKLRRSKKPKPEKQPKDHEEATQSYWRAKVTEADEDNEDIAEILLQEQVTKAERFRWIAKVVTAPNAIARLAIAAGAIGFAYWMYDIFYHASNSAEMGMSSKLMGTLFPILLGGAAVLVGGLFFFTTLSKLFENSASGITRDAEWPGFSIGDWINPLLFFMFSVWLSSLPGILAGIVFTLAFKAPIWIGIFGSFAVFLLAPLLWLSAAFNGSPFNVFAPEVIKTFRFDDTRWFSYLPIAVLLWFGFLAGVMILTIPTVIFAVLGAAIQVACGAAFAIHAGLFCGRYITRLQRELGIR